MSTPLYDVAIIGGGIVGMATAAALVSRWPLSLIVVEEEDCLAAHQSGHNSGVIHSGLYYKPGSLKARLCAEGREAMFRFCQAHEIAYERCGKLIVATSESELPLLKELDRRGKANGLQGLRRLSPEEILEHEPYATGIAGLFVTETGIVDYAQVTRAFADLVRKAGGIIRTKAHVYGVRRQADMLLIHTTGGEISSRYLINCGGLQSDRIARMCGVNPGLRIIPFRGEYYELTPERRHVVRNLIYPVPDPRFPFLGVHFTRRIQGGIEAGPNAVLAFKRQGYHPWDISLADVKEMASYGGFWRMSRRYWKTGLGEFHRSLSKGAFVKALQRLIPGLGPDDLRQGGAGVRAQAVEPTGLLVDDFRIVEAARMTHVLNAPSPAATASISIGRTIADLAAKRLGLPGAPTSSLLES
jgi:L-2-hydroxyglutarate oxidase